MSNLIFDITFCKKKVKKLKIKHPDGMLKWVNYPGFAKFCNQQQKRANIIELFAKPKLFGLQNNVFYNVKTLYMVIYVFHPSGIISNQGLLYLKHKVDLGKNQLRLYKSSTGVL